MDNSAETNNPEREQFIKQLDVGQYLKQLRGERSLASICMLIKITPAHLSEIERLSMPSASLISALAIVYEMNEDDLFLLWGNHSKLHDDDCQLPTNYFSNLVQPSRY